MSIKRQLLTYDGRSIDYRVGSGALEQLSGMIRSVMGGMRRALIVHGPDITVDAVRAISIELEDLDVTPCGLELPGIRPVATLGRTADMFATMAAEGITRDDAIIGFGDAEVCSLVSFCAATWCGATQSILIPTTLDAMVTVATSMRALDTATSREMVSLPPDPALVACDLALVQGAAAGQLRAGHLALLRSALFGSRYAWERFGEQTAEILAGEQVALCEQLLTAQSARLSITQAANPSARHALSFGETTARALRACLGAAPKRWELLAEGMRFEARLAVDAAQFDVDAVFELDDRLEDLGIAEMRFTLDEEAFARALAAERARRSNRFLFALPRNPGTIRLTAVDSDVLTRHIRAFLRSRAEGDGAGLAVRAAEPPTREE